MANYTLTGNIIDYNYPKEDTKKESLIYNLEGENKSKELKKIEDIKDSTDLGRDDSYLKFMKELFSNRTFVTNENWDKTINVDSKIIYKDDNVVVCDCLVDKERNVFEKMSFPTNIFKHIVNISKSPYVILSIKSKTGSTRIDVVKGAELVDKKAFELREEWEKLDESDFNQPLDKPIKL